MDLGEVVKYRYRLEHSLAVTDDEVENEFREYYARYSSGNQIIDSSLVDRIHRTSYIELIVRPDGVFPCSGTFIIPSELAPVSYCMVSNAFPATPK